jgi:hypothetical protein
MIKLVRMSVVCAVFQASSISRSTVKQDAAAILQEKLVASAAALGALLKCF